MSDSTATEWLYGILAGIALTGLLAIISMPIAAAILLWKMVLS